MLGSLSSMIFGSPEDGAGNPAVDNQQDLDVEFKTTEEEMGWQLVDVSRTRRPSLPEAQEMDKALQKPDGSLFDGVLELTSSDSDSGDEGAEGGKVTADFSAQWPSISQSSHAEGDDSEEDEVVQDESDSSSCVSSLLVIYKSSEEGSDIDSGEESGGMAQSPELCPFLTDSWMLTPPPCFTGTNISRQIQFNPQENRLIEHASFYANLNLFRHQPVACSEGWHTLSVLREMKESHQAIERRREAEGRNMEANVEQLQMLKKRLWKPSQKASQQQQQVAPCSDARAQVEAQTRRPTYIQTRCELVAQEQKQLHLQRLQQKMKAKKHLSKNCMERGNKALMAQSYGRSQLSARNRLLRPSGGKCGRYSQRAH